MGPNLNSGVLHRVRRMRYPSLTPYWFWTFWFNVGSMPGDVLMIIAAFSIRYMLDEKGYRLLCKQNGGQEIDAAALLQKYKVPIISLPRINLGFEPRSSLST